MVVIGEYICYPQRRDEIMMTVRKEFFYKTIHQQDYDKLLKLCSDNPKITDEMIWIEFKGRSYELIKYRELAFTEWKVTEHIKELTEIYHRRELYNLALNILDKCDTCSSDKTKLAIEKRINLLTNGHYDIKSVKEIVEENNGEEGYNKLTKSILTTGIEQWDNLVITKPGQLNIIAGRPSQGKTAFMLHLAKANAIHDFRVGIISLEMQNSSLINRMALSEAKGIDFQQYLIGCNKIYNLPIYINDNENYNLMQVANIANVMIKRHTCDVLYIDYLQLMQSEGQTLYYQVTELSKGLKAIAKRTTKPIFCLAQLSRAPESRANHRPMLADLRDSGSIEQDADIVVFVYRPCKYQDVSVQWQNKKDKSEFKDVVNLETYFETDIAKQRDGAVGILKWYYEPSRHFFASLENRGEALQENIF